jgi:hypothetical protein
MTSSLSEMCFVTPELLNCIRKLDITLGDAKEGKHEININWDETDSELEPWMALTEEEQTNFILACLNSQLSVTTETKVVE